jgi:HSP20 family protein
MVEGARGATPGAPASTITPEEPPTMERWDPMRDVVSLRDAVNSLIQDSILRPGAELIRPGVERVAGVPVDVAETEGEFVIKASLPGVKPEEVQITAHGDTVTLRGEMKAEEEAKGQTWHVRERRHGAFQRSITLSAPIDADRAKATYDLGVLTLTLPKAETARPRQIKIGP